MFVACSNVTWDGFKTRFREKHYLMRGYIMRRSQKVIKTLRVHLEGAVSAGPSVFKGASKVCT